MPIRIGIVGGGIGGLTLAVALSRLDLEGLIEVNIYESAPELTQIGAGITFWPRAWNIIEKLGLSTALAEQLAPGQHVPDGKPRLAFQFRKSDQRPGVSTHDLVIAGLPLSFHRASVQAVLLRFMSPWIKCRLSRRLLSYEISTSTNEIILRFDDDSSESCNFLIGADGLKSTVRKQLVSQNPLFAGEPSEPIWSGTYAYRFMIDSHLIRSKMPEHRVLFTPTIYCGKNKHIVVYPILQGKVINAVAYVSNPKMEGTTHNGPSFQDVSKEEVVSMYRDWEEEVQVIVEHITTPSRWAIHALHPLPSYSSGNVVLLGDAAHAMTPHQGNGSGQAIEDAYILAHLIKQATRNPGMAIAKVVQIYDAVRRPFANSVLDASRTQGLLYEFNTLEFEDVVEGQNLSNDQLKRLGELIVGDWEYAWTTTAEEQLEQCIA